MDTSSDAEKSMSNLDVEALDERLRGQLHRALYRQECRAWLLWCLLSLLLHAGINSVLRDLPLWFFAPLLFLVILYAWFISFWVIGPSQELLEELRTRAGTERSRQIEGTFDDSWASVRDFVPPLLIPPLLLLAIALFEVFRL